MKSVAITADNAVLATRYLFALDLSSINIHFHKDVASFRVELLKKAHIHYLNLNHSSFNRSEKLFALSDSLSHLADCAQSLSELLYEEAKLELAQWLLINKTEEEEI